MEATALSVGKSVLDGALGYARSAAAEEVALQLGVQRDQAFIRDELQMMQAFLMAAHEERGDRHQVLMAWVKQVRDVAYDAEDILQDFSIHLDKPSWWRLPRTLRERRRIAKQMKDLRARVEDVSQRNLRYQLIRGAGSQPATAAELSDITATAVFGIDGARRAAKQEEPKEDLIDLINKGSDDLRVIAVWGTSGDLGIISIINTAYEHPDIKNKFQCRAWVRVLHPFNPNSFIQSLVKQFRLSVGVDILLETEKTGQELAEEFLGYINEKSFLIVLNDLSTFEEWSVIKTCFSKNKRGSRIIVCTSQVEVASLCAGQGSHVLELKQLSADQTIYAFHEKDSEDRTKFPIPMSNSKEATTSTNESVIPTDEILGDKSEAADERKIVIKKSFTRIRTTTSALEVSQLIGREKEKHHVAELISNQPSHGLQVISVWGMGGLGKTTLVKDVYQSQKLIGMFEKRACVTVMRPFIPKEILRSLIAQLNIESSEKKAAIDLGHNTRKSIAMLSVEELTGELARIIGGKKCLIILDDLSSTTEWDSIIRIFPKLENTCQIVVTTREETIARYCCEKQGNIYKLEVLGYKGALDLFTKKVFKESINLDKHPELIEEANLILKKCNGLPLAIVTIGGFLANQPKTAVEWRKLNEHISAELEMNPELEPIKTVLGKSYDGLPYHLKSCFLYMSLFPEDHKVSRRRLMRRWSAEGYSRKFRGKSAEEIADCYFKELIDRSMILPSQKSIHNRKGIDCCQVHDLMREISMSKSTEENLVFRLEEGCSSNTQGTFRHLAVGSNWRGDSSEFESTVDLSRIRSLTVFGKWRPFFISDKIRMLRVLDLEDTSDLYDHHLEHIGKLLHLRYLSLRGCKNVHYLPDSWGNMRQLQTLDITGTGIMKLPKTITKLTKLQYIRSGWKISDNIFSPEEDVIDLPKSLQNELRAATMMSVFMCLACCSPQIFPHFEPNRSDICTMYWFAIFPLFLGLITCEDCVVLPRGMGKLKALQTLGFVSLADGKDALREIKRLTQLRKLGVTGVSIKNSKEFCSALADLSNLESLFVQSRKDSGLCGCLDDLSCPPKNLQSLKLYGNLGKLPEWINRLQNLAKLTLIRSKISDGSDVMQVLGKLPSLSILRLREKSFEGKELRLNFLPEAFMSLIVLELVLEDLKSVKFEEETSPKLEMLQFRGSRSYANVGFFSGLASLPSLKEFILQSNELFEDDFLEDVQTQLGENPNAPVLKRYD